MAPFDMVRVSESLGFGTIEKGLQTSFNPFVVGSTPAGPTRIFKGLAARLGPFYIGT